MNYLSQQLQARGVCQLAGVTGNSADPTALAWRFSPLSNGKREEISQSEELRVLIATDVLSEGHSQKNAHIVVNYDLPWAISSKIQRAGRVDRIGQEALDILCYTFWPADGGPPLSPPNVGGGLARTIARSVTPKCGSGGHRGERHAHRG